MQQQGYFRLHAAAPVFERVQTGPHYTSLSSLPPCVVVGPRTAVGPDFKGDGALALGCTYTPQKEPGRQRGPREPTPERNE